MSDEGIFDAVVRQGVVDFRAVACTLYRQRVPWCVHGGFAVNHYAPPAIYAADLWIVLRFSSLASTLADLDRQGFFTQAFAATRGIPEPTAHRLRVRFDCTERYQGFPARAGLLPLLGVRVPVAGLVDILQGLLWAALDPDRSLIQKGKAELDVLRLAVGYPAQVDPFLPDDLRARAEAERAHIAAHPAGDGWGEDDAPTCLE